MYSIVSDPVWYSCVDALATCFGVDVLRAVVLRLICCLSLGARVGEALAMAISESEPCDFECNVVDHYLMLIHQ